MRLIICGGRHFRDMALVERELTRINAARPIDVLVHGGSAGIGMPVEAWGQEHDVHIVRYPPCRTPGRNSDARRDMFMLSDGRPDAMLAFPGGRRTKALVQMAEAQGIPVISVESGLGSGNTATGSSIDPGLPIQFQKQLVAV
jgi:YspA, cpYpsA-related SLOG family